MSIEVKKSWARLRAIFPDPIFKTINTSDDDDDDDANDDGDDEELKQIWIILMMIMMYSKRVERKQQNMLTDKYKFKFPEKSFKSRGVSQNRF